MSIFDPRVWLAFLAALVLAYGAGRMQQHHSDTKAFQAERTAAALQASQERNKAVDEARAEEQRRTNAQAEIANEATKQADAARADARAAGDAADKLRARVAQLVTASRAAGHSTAAGTGPSQSGGDPLDVLVDVLGRSDNASGELAGYADRLKVAGLACERDYDALIVKR